MKRPVEVIVLSNVQLGCSGIHAEKLVKYLKSINPQTIILNGNFLNLKELKKRQPDKYIILVFQQILKFASKGVRIYYLTGRKDYHIERHGYINAGTIFLRHKMLIQINNQLHWIFPDERLKNNFSNSFIQMSTPGKKHKWWDLAKWFSYIKNVINKLYLKAFFMKIRKMNYSHNQINFINTALDIATAHGYQTVISGYQTSIREMQNGKTKFINTGNWYNNQTTLEYTWSEWRIFEYDELDFSSVNPKLQVKTSRRNDVISGRHSVEFPVLLPYQ